MVSQFVADIRDKQGCEDIPGGIERLIAAELPVESPSADDTKRNGGYTRA